MDFLKLGSISSIRTDSQKLTLVGVLFNLCIRSSVVFFGTDSLSVSVTCSSATEFNIGLGVCVSSGTFSKFSSNFFFSIKMDNGCSSSSSVVLVDSFMETSPLFTLSKVIVFACISKSCVVCSDCLTPKSSIDPFIIKFLLFGIFGNFFRLFQQPTPQSKHFNATLLFAQLFHFIYQTIAQFFHTLCHTLATFHLNHLYFLAWIDLAVKFKHWLTWLLTWLLACQRLVLKNGHCGLIVHFLGRRLITGLSAGVLIHDTAAQLAVHIHWLHFHGHKGFIFARLLLVFGQPPRSSLRFELCLSERGEALVPLFSGVRTALDAEADCCCCCLKKELRPAGENTKWAMDMDEFDSVFRFSGVFSFSSLISASCTIKVLVVLLVLSRSSGLKPGSDRTRLVAFFFCTISSLMSKNKLSSRLV
ncbi:hypothetical protein BpHYR1_023579 [Brachionus plicatilis]|uniref:Uncharacterized protein n=1 Tax=Brachionus plicatilis TaxID=10195 RepID=A0A3M7TB39_BRAPC|nr:hypothetical protein BpHYR1_023579 [Brachionus plicatilis]